MTHTLRAILLMFLSIAPLAISMSQEIEYSAMIPTFHDGFNTSGRESRVQLRHQRFIVFVYRNAVAVSSEADYVNLGRDTLSQEFGLPSTGHSENGRGLGGRVSNGLLSVQLWLEGERVAPDFTDDGIEEWYTIRVRFAPGEQRRVKAIFWAQTSFADVDSLPGLDTLAIAIGKRGFMLDLSHAAVWNSVIESIDVTVVMKGGMTFQRDAFTAEPGTYDLRDSTITWSLRNVEPSPRDNIIVSYTPSGSWGSATNTMAKLARYIVGNGYDSLLSYVKQIDEERDH